MAKKNIIESNRSQISGKPRNTTTTTAAKCHSSTKYFKTIVSSSPPPLRSDSDRLSPVRVASPPKSLGSSPRTSPGLLAGHYAGCKFTEPPLPSALPLPPQHWTQTPHSVIRAFVKEKAIELPDIAQQLKVLLKVQA